MRNIINFLLLMTSMSNLNAATVGNVEIPISGLWWLTDGVSMRKFLRIKPDDKYNDFCMEILENEKSAKIFFVDYDPIYKVDIVKISRNRYSLKYNGATREFVVDNNPKNSGTEKRLIYFLDTKKFPPNINRFASDGGHYQDVVRENSNATYSVQGLIEQIKAVYSIDSPDY